MGRPVGIRVSTGLPVCISLKIMPVLFSIKKPARNTGIPTKYYRIPVYGEKILIPFVPA